MEPQPHKNTMIAFGRGGEAHTLFACPFCGTAHDLELDDFAVEDDPEDLSPCFVTCLYCGCVGPAADTATEAVDGWNRRLAAYTPHWN